MSLPAGTRLGPYEVLSALGAGGMGEVYRARDTRLGRDVAIKVLPPSLASDPERLKRFEREARSASALNHPAIVSVFDVGSEGGVAYIALELVRGQSLRERLRAGALPIREVLHIGAQTAEGLARAHTSGIVHRDLKPENLMLSEDGYAKILDFGLAKLTGPDAGRSDESEGPTVSGATEPGIVMGTAGYMSPEQAVGGPVDFRSDQFSLGAILYEMTVGRRAFERDSVPQTMSAVIQDEPEPIAHLNPGVPVPLCWLIERCLAKDPRQRYAATDDLARDLALIRERIRDAPRALEAAPRASSRGGARPWAFAASALVALALIGAVLWGATSRRAVWRNPLAGATFTRLTDWEGSEMDAAVSRDGKLVAFLSDRDGPLEAWVTQVGSGDFANLSRGRLEVLYIDELRAIGFADGDSHAWVRVMVRDSSAIPGEAAWLFPVLGGNPRPYSVPGAAELAWSADGTHVVYHTAEPGDPIYVADPGGSVPRLVCRGTPGVHEHFPTWSPDGRFIYFVRGIPGVSDLDIWRVRASGGEPERLTSHHSHVAYIAFLGARTLLYTAGRPDGQGSGLYAMDVDRRVPHEISLGLEECLSIDASADGRRLVAALGRSDRNLWTVPIVDRAVGDSAAHRYRVPSVRAAAPRFGRDCVLYLSSHGGPDGLWKFERGVETELWRGADGAVPVAPAVSPDGGRIAFVVRREGRSRLYVMGAGESSPRLLAPDLEVRDAPSFSPDGKRIVVSAGEGAEKQPLYEVPVDGGPVRRLMDGIAYGPVWSPDGRFIVYGEGRRGRTLPVRAVTPEGRPHPLPGDLWVSRSDAFRFTPDGKSLVLLRGEMRAQDFWRLDLATNRLIRLTALAPGFQTRSFDISPDGKEILFDRYRENSDLALIDLPSRPARSR